MQRRYHQNKTAHVGHENKLKKRGRTTFTPNMGK